MGEKSFQAIDSPFQLALTWGMKETWRLAKVDAKFENLYKFLGLP